MAVQLFVDTRAIRAEQFRPNMTKILGRTIVRTFGVTSFQPHTRECEIRPGQVAVEIADKKELFNGQPRPGWPVVLVMDEAEFKGRFRFVGEA